MLGKHNPTLSSVNSVNLTSLWLFDFTWFVESNSHFPYIKTHERTIV